MQFRDVNSELVDRCCRIWTEYEQVKAQASAIRTASKLDSTPFRQFIEAASKFQELLQNKWKDGVIKARQNEDGDDSEVEKAAIIAETNPEFKVSRLKRWLRFKQAEVEMAAKIKSMNGIAFLNSQPQLEVELVDSFDKKYSLVLYIPALEDQTNAIVDDMTAYVENYSTLVIDDEDKGTDEDTEDKLPWHMVERRRKLVMDKISEMAQHANKNKHLTKAQFFVVADETGSKFECFYSIYESENLLYGNFSQLPTPPMGLNIETIATAGETNRPKMSALPIRLMWNYEDQDYPCIFLVKYRPSNDPGGDWKQQKTSKLRERQMTIHLRQNTSMEIRMATETCIGRSEFTEIVAIVAESTLADSDMKTSMDNIEGELKGKEIIYSLAFLLLQIRYLYLICRDEIGYW